jgi:hypothetical protein
MHDVITFSIEHAVSSGSIDDIACAVRSHPCVLLIPHELLEDASHASFWDVVRFITDAEIATSGGGR